MDRGLFNFVGDKSWVVNIFTALVYIACGHLGFLLSMGIGPIEMIWPPAGVMLGFVLLYGYRIWPGIYFGAVYTAVTNFGPGFADFAELISQWQIIFLPIGAVMQPLLTVWMLRRLDLIDHDFSEPKNIGQFYLIAGPIGSVINASYASFVAMLVLGDNFSGAPSNWIIWWMVDAGSVIVFVTFVLAAARFENTRRNIVVGVTLVGLGLAWGIFYVGQKWEDERIALLFDQEVLAAVDVIERMENSYRSLANSLVSYKSYMTNITKEDFDEFGDNNLPLNDTVRSFGWIRVINGEDRAAYVNRLSEFHGRDVQLWELDQTLQRVKATTMDEYHVIAINVPDELSYAVGYVVNSNEIRKTAMEKALQTNEITSTPPMTLSSDPNGPPSLTFYVPTYTDNVHDGYFTIVVRVEALIDGIISTTNKDHMEVRLRDTNAPDAPRFTSAIVYDGYGDPNPVRRDVTLFDRTFEMEFLNTMPFITANASEQPMLIGIVGQVVASFMTIGIIMLSGQRIYLEKLVVKRTQELENANRTKSKFMANMSHDLRTPLNAIIGFSEIMKQQIHGKHSSDKYREYSEDINQSSSYLLSLINDILDLSALDAGKRELVKQEVELKPLLDECMRILDPLLREKGHNTTIKIAEDFESVFADARSMKQILINLLSNAIKFTPSGGEIKIRSYLDNDKKVISIKDNGEGIAKKDIKKMLNPFSRAQNHPHLSQEGTGLGLSIVNSLVELHDGSLVINSSKGKGTNVKIVMPGT